MRRDCRNCLKYRKRTAAHARAARAANVRLSNGRLALVLPAVGVAIEDKPAETFVSAQDVLLQPFIQEHE